MKMTLYEKELKEAVRQYLENKLTTVVDIADEDIRFEYGFGLTSKVSSEIEIK